MIPETKILVLKDMDMNSGKPVNEEIREQYLAKYPENHRVLSRFEIENYLYDKEVLNIKTLQDFYSNLSRLNEV